MQKNLRPEDLGDLLNQAQVAILATHRPDGSTMLTPVWHEWRDGGFTLGLDGKDMKIRNLRRDPRLSVVVAEDGPPYRGIEVRGEARFVDTDAAALMRRLAERYLKDRDIDGFMERYRGWIKDAVVVRVEPGVLRAWDYADEEW